MPDAQQPKTWKCEGCGTTLAPSEVIMSSLHAREGGHAVAFSGRDVKLLCGPVTLIVPPASDAGKGAPG